MTFTIMARCQRTGQLGIALATFSLAAGGYCPFVKVKVGAVSSQAFAHPTLGLRAIQLLETGSPPDDALVQLSRSDNNFEYRQVGIVDANDGHVSVHTGRKSAPWAGHIVGEGFVAMGNMLVGERVVQEMARAFGEGLGLDLDERLLRALEAGHDAGGQQLENRQLPERSAGLVVYADEPYALMDLRVDMHETAIAELRRVHATYKPYIPLYYQIRPKQPHLYIDRLNRLLKP
ncbi:DUF1028 domain-containing protein [Chloroflexota bacterium]